jgi:hypothetical protein
LTADRTYYVSTTGDDTNDGLSSGAPFLTIQKAVDIVCSLDLGIFQATIQLADGTYTAGAVLKPYIGALAPTINGNSVTPTNVVINGGSSPVFYNKNGMIWSIQNLGVGTSGEWLGSINAIGAAETRFSNLNFLSGGTNRNHLMASGGGIITCYGDYSISSSGYTHCTAQACGIVTIASVTITITGTPAFSTAYARAVELSTLQLRSCNFVGSCTGKRYDANLNSIIATVGGGASYLPGSLAGTTATGAQYS